MRRPVALIAAALVLAACASVERPPADGGAPTPTLEAPTPWPDPPPVPVPDGELDASVAEAADRPAATGRGGAPDARPVATVAASGDARLAWLLGDLLRFAVTPDAEATLLLAIEPGPGRGGAGDARGILVRVEPVPPDDDAVVTDGLRVRRPERTADEQRRPGSGGLLNAAKRAHPRSAARRPLSSRHGSCTGSGQPRSI